MKSSWKLLLICLGAWSIFLSWGTHASNTTPGNEFYYSDDNGGSSYIGNEIDTNYGKLITTDAVKKNNNLLIRLMTEAFNLDIINKYKGPQKAFAYIKFIISYALAFVSFVAFLLLLYGFYMMLIGDGEKGRDKVKSTLKGIVIAIIAMSLSWLIVSALFWIYENPAQKDSPTTQSRP